VNKSKGVGLLAATPSHGGFWSPRLTLMLAISILLLVGASLLALNSVTSASMANAWFVHTERVRLQISRVLQLLTDVESAARGFAVSQDEAFLEPYRAAIPMLPSELMRLKTLVANNTGQTALALRLAGAVTARTAECQEVVEHAAGGDAQGARSRIADGEGRHTMQTVRSIVAQMQSEEERLLVVREHAAEGAQRNARYAAEAVGVLGTFLVAFVAYATTRDGRRVRRAQEGFFESAQRFRAAVDAVQGVLWTNTVEGEMRGEQPGWAALTGQEFSEYQGLGWTKAVHPDDAQPTIDAWIDAVSERRLFVFEHRVRRHDGQWRHFSIRAVPLIDGNGGIREWVGVHTDITEKRRSEQALRLSEARFRAIQETSIDGFMVFESVRGVHGDIVDFRWIHANSAAERIIGKSREWLIGRHLLEELPGHRDVGLFDAYVRVVETGQPWANEASYQRDGVDAYLRLVAAKSEDGFAVSLADMTERQRVEEQVRERERQFVALANAMPQIVWTERPDGTHAYFNLGWYAYTGLTEEESQGRDAWTRVLHPEDEARTGGRWRRSRTTGEPYEIEFRLRRHDGAYRWFLARAVADIDADGRIHQWFGTCTDIDSTKRTEESLRDIETALREADWRKDVFLATLSHELRNPLAPIRNAARLLENPNLSAQDVERSRLIISRQVRHMASLLDDLLDMSRITRGMFSLKKSHVGLQSLLSEALETARPLIDAKRHTLTLDWPEEPLELEADPVRLVQVMTNLLTNAAKYTDPEGHITFRVAIEGEQLIIVIRDTGIGLSRDALTKVFDMFSQVDAHQERTEGGLGIGLALVRGLVELHGGRVDAQSAGAEQGSEFTVSLPCVRRPPQLMAASAPAIDSAEAADSRHRVLIADDNRDGADSLAMLLMLAGFDVHTVHTGPEALDAANTLRPQIAILDIGMPGMNGYEVARRIRNEAWGAGVTLIAVTGWGQEDDKTRARTAGFDHHLTKPVDFSVLEQLLRPRAITSDAPREDGVQREIR
jgi:PAS domain S-box-containing protein